MVAKKYSKSILGIQIYLVAPVVCLFFLWRQWQSFWIIHLILKSRYFFIQSVWVFLLWLRWEVPKYASFDKQSCSFSRDLDSPIEHAPCPYEFECARIWITLVRCAVRLLDRHLMMNGTPKVVRVKTNLAGAAINLSTPLVCDRAKKLITKPALGAGAICMNQYARMCETTVTHTYTGRES